MDETTRALVQALAGATHFRGDKCRLAINRLKHHVRVKAKSLLDPILIRLETDSSLDQVPDQDASRLPCVEEVPTKEKTRQDLDQSQLRTPEEESSEMRRCEFVETKPHRTTQYVVAFDRAAMRQEPDSTSRVVGVHTRHSLVEVMGFDESGHFAKVLYGWKDSEGVERKHAWMLMKSEVYGTL